MEIVDWGERTAGSESRRARNRRHRSKASTAVTAGTSRPLPAPPPPHEAGYVPRLRPGTGRQPAAARPGSTIPSWGLEGRANIEQGCRDSPRLQGAQEHRTPRQRGDPNHAVLIPRFIPSQPELETKSEQRKMQGEYGLWIPLMSSRKGETAVWY